VGLAGMEPSTKRQKVSGRRVVRTIEELRELVGQELGVGPWLEITQERIDAFAEVTGDHQWIHVDPARAQASPFGGTIAHGYLTLALLPLLSRETDGVQLELDPRMSVNYGLNRVRFISPIRVGRRIRARVTLVRLEAVAEGVYQLTHQRTVEIEGEQRPALVAETLTRLYL
jgi:acyl dehydratase